MHHSRFVLALVTAFAMSSSIASRSDGASIALFNGDFEMPEVPSDGDPNTASDGDDFVTADTIVPSGWSVSGPFPDAVGQLTVQPGSFLQSRLSASPGSSGDQSHWANGSETHLYQVATVSLAPDTVYVLNVDLGDRLDHSFPAGTTVRLGTGEAPGMNLLTPGIASNPIPPDGGWATWENVYVTGSHPSGIGDPLRVELLSGGLQAQFDNVRLQRVALPETGRLVEVLNPSFAEPVVPIDGDPTTTSDGDDYASALLLEAPGWQVSGANHIDVGQLTRVPNSFFHDKIGPSSGASDDQNHFANNPDTFFYQVVEEALAPNTAYRLTVDLGDRTDEAFPVEGTEIRLGIGDTAGARLLAPASRINPPPPDGGWSTWENIYVTSSTPAGLGEPLRIELISGGVQAQFDNVRLEAMVIPEPGTWGLAAAGLFVLACCRWRRRS